jgi:hypothetical protein
MTLLLHSYPETITVKQQVCDGVMPTPREAVYLPPNDLICSKPACRMSKWWMKNPVGCTVSARSAGRVTDIDQRNVNAQTGRY